jgi:hypothetical protein
MSCESKQGVAVIPRNFLSRGERKLMRNPIWFFSAGKTNRIPDTSAFLQKQKREFSGMTACFIESGA